MSLPGYLDVVLRDVLDAGRQGDRYVARFTDGSMLAIRHDGVRSSWLDDHDNFDPWTLATRLSFEEVPDAIRAEIWRRATELAQLLL